MSDIIIARRSPQIGRCGLRRLLECLVTVLTVVGLNACGSTGGRATPEEAARQAITYPAPQTSGQNEEQQDTTNHPLPIQIQGTLALSQGVIVLYFYSNTEEQPQGPIFGYVFTVQARDEWFPLSVSFVERDTDPKDVVSYDVVSIPGNVSQDKQEMVIYGRVLEPDVHTIEAVAANGQVLPGELMGQMFALAAQPGVTVCRLRIRDAQRNMLKEVVVSSSGSSMQQVVQDRLKACPSA